MRPDTTPAIHAHQDGDEEEDEDEEDGGEEDEGDPRDALRRALKMRMKEIAATGGTLERGRRRLRRLGILKARPGGPYARQPAPSDAGSDDGPRRSRLYESNEYHVNKFFTLTCPA